MIEGASFAFDDGAALPYKTLCKRRVQVSAQAGDLGRCPGGGVAEWLKAAVC
jgi:hypothetical protein